MFWQFIIIQSSILSKTSTGTMHSRINVIIAKIVLSNGQCMALVHYDQRQRHVKCLQKIYQCLALGSMAIGMQCSYMVPDCYKMVLDYFILSGLVLITHCKSFSLKTIQLCEEQFSTIQYISIPLQLNILDLMLCYCLIDLCICPVYGNGCL